MSGRASGSVELVLERDRFAPGDAVCGSVTPGPQVWAIDLVRVESSPASTLEFTVASVSGRACSLVWRVRARTSEFPKISDSRQTLEIACPS
jgi:hypothetical protein